MEDVTVSEGGAVVVVASEIRESASGLSSISGAEDLRMMEGRLPVVVEVADVATVIIDSEAIEVISYISWLTLEDMAVSTRVADLDRTLLEETELPADDATKAAAEAASHAGHGRLVLLKRELVSELELLLSLVPVELPNLQLLLNLITLKTSTLSDSNKESWLRPSGSSSKPTGVTREGFPRPGGS